MVVVAVAMPSSDETSAWAASNCAVFDASSSTREHVAMLDISFDQPVCVICDFIRFTADSRTASKVVLLSRADSATTDTGGPADFVDTVVPPFP